jgi:CRISPR/Cas system-associated protein Cas10 (large subunit of type III CRISPR-Cas system)
MQKACILNKRRIVTTILAEQWIRSAWSVIAYVFERRWNSYEVRKVDDGYRPILFILKCQFISVWWRLENILVSCFNTPVRGRKPCGIEWMDGVEQYWVERMWKKWPEDYLTYYGSIAIAKLKESAKILSQDTHADLGTRDSLTSKQECQPLQCSTKPN